MSITRSVVTRPSISAQHVHPSDTCPLHRSCSLFARCTLAASDAAIAGLKAIVRQAATPQDSDLSGCLAVPFVSVECSQERVNSTNRRAVVDLYRSPSRHRPDSRARMGMLQRAPMGNLKLPKVGNFGVPRSSLRLPDDRKDCMLCKSTCRFYLNLHHCNSPKRCLQ